MFSYSTLIAERSLEMGFEKGRAETLDKIRTSKRCIKMG